MQERIDFVRRMSREETAKSLELVTKLQEWTRSLTKLERFQEELRKRKNEILERNLEAEAQLKNLETPNLTDLDFDVIMAVPGGIEKAMNYVSTAVRRCDSAREEVENIWHEFNRVLPSLQEARDTEKRLEEVQIASKELQTHLEAANVEYAKVERERQRCEDLQALIENLEERVEGTSGTTLARLELLQEESVATKLQGQAERLERAEEEYTREGYTNLRETLHKQIAERHKRVHILVDEVTLLQERIERRRLGRPDTPDQELLDRQHRAFMNEAQSKAELVWMRERRDALENQVNQQARSHAERVSALQLDLSAKEAHIQNLQLKAFTEPAAAQVLHYN